MNNEDIKSLLIKKLNLKEAYIEGDSNHIKIIAVGDIFKGMSPVKRQQSIYTPLIQLISNKYIHAISIDSYTIKEWKTIKNNTSDAKHHE